MRAYPAWARLLLIALIACLAAACAPPADAPQATVEPATEEPAGVPTATQPAASAPVVTRTATPSATVIATQPTASVITRAATPSPAVIATQPVGPVITRVATPPLALIVTPPVALVITLAATPRRLTTATRAAAATRLPAVIAAQATSAAAAAVEAPTAAASPAAPTAPVATAAPAAPTAPVATAAPTSPATPAAPAVPTAPTAPAAPTASPDPAALIQAAFERMDQGQILYNPPEQMRLGHVERIEVRIAAEGGGEGLAEGLQGQGAPQVEAIPVTTFMKVRLLGSGFDITPLSSEEQVVVGGGYTQWAWNVVPKRSGEQPLEMVVTARVKLPGYSDEQKDLQIIRRQIRVQVDPGYALVTFVRTNVDWIVTAVVLPLLAAAAAWLWRRLRHRNPRS